MIFFRVPVGLFPRAMHARIAAKRDPLLKAFQFAKTRDDFSSSRTTPHDHGRKKLESQTWVEQFLCNSNTCPDIKRQEIQ
jgi:hypothetical protein